MSSQNQNIVDDYLNNRWENQQKYFSSAAKKNKKRHQITQLIIGIGAVMLPAIITFGDIPLLFPSVISLIVAIATAVENINKFGDNWYNYRLVSESLKRERWLYKTNSGPYRRTEHKFELFVEHCEEIIKEDNGRFNPQSNANISDEPKRDEIINRGE